MSIHATRLRPLVCVLVWGSAVGAEPRPEDEPVEPTSAEPPAPPVDRREARQQRREAEGPPKKEADFLSTDTELRLRFGFNGYTPGPFSLLSAFAGWQEFSLVLDKGAFTWKEFTVGFGGDAHYGQAWLLGAVSQPIANYDDYTFRWGMREAGGAFRTTFHWTKLRGVDPYLYGAVGGGWFHLDARVKNWPLPTQQNVDRGYVRLEAGGGLNWWVPKSERFVVGVELRYLISVQINPVRQLDITWQDDTATFSLYPQHKPPKGFSWVLHAGVRF